MPKPYLNDLRERVGKAAAGGLSARGAAGVLGVSVSSAIRWTRLNRTTGSHAAKPTGGDRRSRLPADAAWLLALIAERPDLTLTEIRQRLRAEQQISVGHGTIWRFFAVRKISFKKNPARRRTRAGRWGRSPRGWARGAAVA